MRGDASREGQGLNGEAATRRHQAYEQRRADFDDADARAREAAELAEIVRSEGIDRPSLDP